MPLRVAGRRIGSSGVATVRVGSETATPQRARRSRARGPARGSGRLTAQPRSIARRGPAAPPSPAAVTRERLSISARAAASASGSFSGSRPPAWAILSRPPPPPPTTAAAALTISPALIPRSTAPASPPRAGDAAARRSPSTTTAGSPSPPRRRSARSGRAFGSVYVCGPGSERAPRRHPARRVGRHLDLGRAPALRCFSSSRRLRLAVGDQLRDVLRRRAQQRRRLGQHAVVLAQQPHRHRPGDRLDPAHVRGARGLLASP